MPEIKTTEIAILGAGAAGLTAAIRLGQLGIPCLLIDKGEFPRSKICGDGLSGKTLSALKRLNPQYIDEIGKLATATSSQAARFFSPRGKMLQLGFRSEDLSHPPGLICERFHFDHFLYSKAISSGKCGFVANTRISQITRENGQMILSDPDGEKQVRCSLLLFGAEANKGLIRQFHPGYPVTIEEGIGIRGYFDRVTGADQLHAIEIHFFRELLPWYFWIFPFADGSANVGLALPESQARKLDKSLKQILFSLIADKPHLKMRFSQASLKGKLEAHRLPVYASGGCPVAGDGFMLIGDAARLIDPFTGEGIGNAMVSGFKAAETASKCYKNGDFSLKYTGEYENEIREKLYPELDLSLKLQNLARKQRLLNLVIGKASKDEKLRDLMSDMLYSTYTKSKLNHPWFYLKLLTGI